MACNLLFGQTSGDTILTDAEQMPYFLGCNEMETEPEAKKQCSERELVRFISRYLVYPEQAKENGVQGTVLVSFVVDENGMVQSPAILSDIGEGCGEAALDVLREMPRWEPAQHHGHAVAVRLNMPVQFYLRADERDRAERFSLNWAGLKGNAVTVGELSDALTHAVHVRGPEGDTRYVDELEFSYEKKGRIVSGIGRGIISSELEKVVERVKQGGTFTIRASVQEGGEFVSVVRSFEVVE